MFITLGLQRVGATLGTALSYLTVVWGLLLGYLVFDEVCGVKCVANPPTHIPPELPASPPVCLAPLHIADV